MSARRKFCEQKNSMQHNFLLSHSTRTNTTLCAGYAKRKCDFQFQLIFMHFFVFSFFSFIIYVPYLFIFYIFSMLAVHSEFKICLHTHTHASIGACIFFCLAMIFFAIIAYLLALAFFPLQCNCKFQLELRWVTWRLLAVSLGAFVFVYIWVVANIFSSVCWFYFEVFKNNLIFFLLYAKALAYVCI